MKEYGGVEVQFHHPTYISAVDGGKRFTPGERSASIHWIAGWVGPKAGLDIVEKRQIFPLPGFEPRPSSP
jgi:hypothetical protein